MIQQFTHITILVKNYDEALEFYTKKLGFELNTDVDFQGMRWLTINPVGQKEMEFCLMVPTSKEGLEQIGKQGGEYGIGCLGTDDAHKTYEQLKSAGVHIVDEPKQESWGTGFVFKDLYGNTLYVNQAPQ